MAESTAAKATGAAKTALNVAWKTTKIVAPLCVVAGLAFAAPGTTAALGAGIANAGSVGWDIATAAYEGATNAPSLS